MRPQLIERILDHQGPIIANAPAGSGKHALRSVLSGLSSREVVSVPSVYEVPNRDLSGLVILTRDVGPKVAHLPDLLILTEDDLWFSVDETANAIPEAWTKCHTASEIDVAASIIHGATDGWPIAVSVAVKQLRPDVSLPQLRSILNGTTVFEEDLVQLIGPARLSEDGSIGELAHVVPAPALLFTEAFDSGYTDWRAARVAGWPLVRRSDGLIDMPRPFRRFAQRCFVLGRERAKRIALCLADEVGVLRTVEILRSTDNSDAAFFVLDSCPRNELDAEDPRELRAHFEALYELDHGSPLFKRRFAETLHETGDSERALSLVSTAEEAALPGTTESWHVSALDRLARAEILAQRGHLREAQTIATTVAGSLDSALEVQARLASVEMNLASSKQFAIDLRRAIEFGRNASALFAAIERPIRAAEIYRRMALGPLLALGRYSDMRRLAERSENEASIYDRRFGVRGHFALGALSSALLADVDAWNAATAIANTEPESSSPATEVQMALSEVVMAGYLRMIEDLHDAYDHFVFWLSRLPNVLLLSSLQAHAACAFAMVGDEPSARSVVETMRTNRHVDERAILFASLVIEGRLGDPKLAEAFGRELKQLGLSPKSWRVELELANARKRAFGQPDHTLLETLESKARVTGMELLFAALGPSERDVGPDTNVLEQPSSPQSEPPTVAVSLRNRAAMVMLGRFRLDVDGSVVDGPSGKARELICLAALRHGTILTDTAIDALWPYVDASVGRTRLRNVITRARKGLGERLERHEDRIVLHDVDTDVAMFQHHAIQALDPAPADLTHIGDANVNNATSTLEAGIAALDLYRGPLFDSGFGIWIDEERWELESIARRLVEFLVEHPQDDAFSTSWLLEAADRVGGFDEALYLRIARKALAQNRRGVAQQAVFRAQHVADEIEIDLVLDPELAELSRRT